MKRLQIQLDDASYEAVRRLAFARHQSVAATIRELLGQTLGSSPAQKRRLRLEDFTFVGAMASDGSECVSENHDDVLGQGRW